MINFEVHLENKNSSEVIVKQFAFTEEEVKEVGNVKDFLTGNEGLIWEFFDREEYMFKEVIEYGEK